MTLRALLVCFLCSLACRAQQARHHFDFTNAKLETVLAAAENAFDIRYSFAADVVAPKTMTLAADFSLAEFNASIFTQTALSVTKIDDRYYALSADPATTFNTLDEIVVESFLSKGIAKSARHFTLSPSKIKELPGRDIVLKLPHAPRRHLADAKARAVVDSFLENLRQPLVEPHRQLRPDRAVRELVKRLVLQCAAKLIPALAF